MAEDPECIAVDFGGHEHPLPRGADYPPRCLVCDPVDELAAAGAGALSLEST